MYMYICIYIYVYIYIYIYISILYSSLYCLNIGFCQCSFVCTSFIFNLITFGQGTIILVISATLLGDGVLLKILKYFEVMSKKNFNIEHACYNWCNTRNTKAKTLQRTTSENAK